jgi:hypothetical protein
MEEVICDVSTIGEGEVDLGFHYGRERYHN